MRLTVSRRLVDRRPPQPRLCDDDAPIIRPPDTVVVHDDRSAVLYTADGAPLVRQAGF
jgi:hypothetical protein